MVQQNRSIVVVVHMTGGLRCFGRRPCCRKSSGEGMVVVDGGVMRRCRLELE
jgi:hypothetical protein